VKVGGEIIPAQISYDISKNVLVLSGISCAPTQRIEIIIENPLLIQGDHHLENYTKIIRSIRANPEILRGLNQRAREIVADPTLLTPYLVALAPAQMKALLEVITEAGVDYQTDSGKKLFVMWNNLERPDVTYLIASEAFPIHDVGSRSSSQQGMLPKYKGIVLDQAFTIPWVKDPRPTLIQVDYGIMMKVRYLFNAEDNSARPTSGLC
jgi:hypothetical protein